LLLNGLRKHHIKGKQKQLQEAKLSDPGKTAASGTTDTDTLLVASY
jgi:hypothetical protein